MVYANMMVTEHEDAQAQEATHKKVSASSSLR
jgi:hypothetical protein